MSTRYVSLSRAVCGVCLVVYVNAAAAAGAAEADLQLVHAAKGQDVAAVRVLLRQKVDVNARQGDGATALHWAAQWDRRDIAGLLLQAGANVNAADDHGVTPLALACLNGSAAMAALLLDKRASVNVASSVGETPLMIAAHTGNVEVVKRLLAAGADVKARESTQAQTALMRGVVQHHSDVVRALIEAGAEVHARSKNRFTPLLFAAQQGDLDVARLLLDAGAHVDESAPDGIGGDTNAARAFKPDTDAAALLVAIDSHHEPMARLLLERGANPNLNGAGRTALHSAVQQQMPALVKTLLEKSADPNARLTKPMPLLSRFILQAHGLEVVTAGATPFWLAASYGDVETMRILRAGGADPHLTSNDGTTPLMVAAGIDFVEGQDKYGRRQFDHDTGPLEARAKAAVLYCLELGADINARNAKGQTAIIGGIYFRSPSLVRFLVEHGAEVNVVNALGQTPWSITQGEYRSGSYLEDPPTADALVSLGADTTLARKVR